MNFLGKIMKNFTKILILLFILMILSISAVNALELDDDMQTVEESAIQEVSIEEPILNDDLEEDLSSNEVLESQSSSYDSEQISVEDTDESLNMINDDETNENPQNNVLTASNGNTHKISPSNYSKYFNNKGIVNTNIVKSGDTVDLSGNFNKVNFTFTIPCSITSSQNNAKLNNCVVQYLDVNSSTYSNVSNLKFTVNIEKHPSVYIVRSSHINVFNCNAYSTGANSNPTLLVGSTYCNIHHNVFETTFTGHMNMSWKRAGILLGESHYNNIYSNDVTIKDSNGIYLTTYGFDKSNYNNIYNNTIRSSAISGETGLPNPSAWAYGVHIMGDYNKAINNRIYLMYRGVDSEGSFNEIIGNDIYNLAGSYYEGNNGTDGGEYGIHASYSNTIINNTIRDSKITEAAIYVTINCTAYGNKIYNISGRHGFEFSTTASNTLVENNFINMTLGNGIYIKGNMTNVTLTGNDIDTKNGTAILIKMLSKSKIPDNITIKNNRILENAPFWIDFTEIESKANVTTFNNSLYLTNATFFKAFERNGIIKNINNIDNIIFKGVFANLGITSININKNVLGDHSNILDIPFVISSSNKRIENLNLTLNNSKSAFKFYNVENITFVNNTVSINSDDYALILNNSKLTIVDNTIKINGNSPAILNDNGSYILFGENTITCPDLEILSLHDSIVKYTFYVLSDDTYDEIFDSNGRFLDDFDIAIGDTLKIADLNNRTIRIDIPLIIKSFQGTSLNNCTLILEDMASNTNLSGLKFKLENANINRDYSFITIKDGVSNLILENINFNASNIQGNGRFSAIRIIGSDESARNIKISNNIFNLTADLESIAAISAVNEGFNNYEDITDALAFSNNNISISNTREDGLAYGLYLINSNNFVLASNNIHSNGNQAYAIYQNNCKFNLNKIYPSNNSLYENDVYVNIIHSNNPTRDIQSIIDVAGSGDIIHLGNSIYSIKDSLIINKSISLFGGKLEDNIDSNSNPLISNDGPIFVIYSTSNTQNTVNLIDMRVTLDNNDLFVLSLLKNSTNPIDVLCPIINIKNCSFLKKNDETDGNSIYLLKSISQRPLFKPINNVNLEGNDFIENMNQIRYYTFNDSSDNEINFNQGIKTTISSKNIVCVALEKSIYGNAVKYIEVKLLDKNNNPLVGKTIYLSYNNGIYSLKSDNNGIAKLPISITSYGIYNVLISFLGDGQFSASFSQVKFTVNKQKAKLTAPNRSYYVNAKKYLKATFKDINGRPIKNKKISFILNGKKYNAYTNSKGIAKIKVKISSAKKYIVTVKYAGDNVYSPLSKSFKVYVKKLKTRLIVKNRSYKKSKKVKKLTATLKVGKKAIKGKKIIFTVNKKKYKAKTNKKGVATVKVKLSKKKTYKFTVKFAGDGTYLKASKKAKLRIK